jgi:hypothetical protein
MILLNSPISPSYQYTTQTYEPLVIETGLLLDQASNPKILYKKPRGGSGQWTAEISGTKLTKTITDGDIILPGEWLFQAYVEIDGKKVFGKIVSYVIDRPILETITPEVTLVLTDEDGNAITTEGDQILNN